MRECKGKGYNGYWFKEECQAPREVVALKMK
jgi:hypothetical protein